MKRKDFLKKLRTFDVNETFQIICDLEDALPRKGLSLKKEWKRDAIGFLGLDLTIHTYGLSEAEEIIDALRKNKTFDNMFYVGWKVGGHHEYRILPELIGYEKVSDYCRNEGISRQYINQIKDRFDVVSVSKNKNYIRKKLLI